MMRQAFVFDQKRCTGCHACRLACTIENDLPLTESWRQVVTFNPHHEPYLPLFHLSIACNHCRDAACMHACPAAAYSRDTTTGAVLIDGAKCIGCRYCTWACPYDAPHFNESSGVVTKCTFCVDRLHDGKLPACAAYCPTGALAVREVGEAELTIRAVGLPDGDRLSPSLQIVPWTGGVESSVAGGTSTPPGSATVPSRVSLRSEWSLVVFTFAAAVLVALLAGHVVAGSPLSLAAFLGSAIPAMALSAAHLGRKERAWRAILGIRTSWLSREVAAFTAFVVTGAVAVAWPSAPNALGLGAVAVGALALFAVDRVYGVAAFLPGARPHSAGALVTGVFLAGVVTGSIAVAALVGALKVVLYLRRKVRTASAWTGNRRILSALRLGFGIVLPATLWTAPSDLWGVLLASVLAGELIDRCEFYEELEIPSPARCMAADLAARTDARTTRIRRAA
jgi:DMSO reductase iron-sulfur subunit